MAVAAPTGWVTAMTIAPNKAPPRLPRAFQLTMIQTLTHTLLIVNEILTAGRSQSQSNLAGGCNYGYFVAEWHCVRHLSARLPGAVTERRMRKCASGGGQDALESLTSVGRRRDVDRAWVRMKSRMRGAISARKREPLNTP